MKEVQNFPSLYDRLNGELKDKCKKQNSCKMVGDLFNLSAKQADDMLWQMAQVMAMPITSNNRH